MNKGYSFVFNKSIILATVFVVILLTGFSLLFVAKATTNNVTVAAQPTDASFWYMMGHVANATFATTQFALLDADTDDSLKTVAFTINAGTPAITAADFDWVAIYKDNGNGVFATATDTLLATGTPAIDSATTITVTDDLTSSAVVYFIVAKLAAGATDGRKFTVDIAADGLTAGTDAAITVETFGGMSTHVVDATAPVVGNTYPANGATNVPLGSFFNGSFTDAGGIDPSTVNPSNITMTKNGTAIPFSLRFYPGSFDLMPSAAPTWAASSRWSEPWVTTNVFANFMHGTAVNFDGSVTFTAGDIVMYQNDNFPPEFGLITNATLTGGTFAVNSWPLMGPMRLIKLATPNATGLITATTVLTTGDLILLNASANPNTSYWYNWGLVTTGAAVNNSALRIDGNAAAPTYMTGSSFSTITPDATVTDNGATADGVLAVSVGDLVYAELAIDNSYTWRLVTTAGNMSSDATEGTAGLDGADAAASVVAATSQMSKITPQGQGAVTATTTLTTGDVIFANATAGASNIGSYNFHFASVGAAVNSSNLRLDNAPSNLTADSTYVVTIKPAIQDLAGNTLAATSTISFSTSSYDPGNTLMPPYIMGNTPSPGTNSFPPNGNLYVEFPQGDAGNMSTSGAGSVTSTDNIILQLTASGAPTGSNLCASSGCALTWDSTARQLKINPATNLTASTEYVLTIKNTITNASGLALTGPDFLNFFTVAAGVDGTGPTLNEADPKNGATGIMRNLSSILLQFNEALDASTVNSTNVVVWEDTNGDGIQDGGETVLTVSRQYDGPKWAVFLGLQQILAQNKKYCSKITTGVKDVVGNAATAATKCFTTVDATFSASAPTVMFADADTFNVWIEFDMPVDFSTGPFGALNKQNYAIENPVGTSLNLNDATFSARPEARAVEVIGLSLQPGTQFKITVTNVKDVSGGATMVANGTTNTAQGTVIDPNTSGAFIGGFDMPDFDQKDFGNFWMSPERCSPFNMMPEQTSNWMCEFPTPAILTTGAKIILTFPAGVDVTNANIVPASQSWNNADMNGWGPGITTITATSTNTSARTVTLTLAHTGDAMMASDQLMFELQGIVNPATAGERTVSAIVKDVDGIKVGQTISFAPFNIIAAGSRTISGTVCKGSTSGGSCDVAGADTAVASASVFLDSMRGMGHFEATTDASGDYSFTTMPDGDYGVGVHMNTSGSFSGMGGGGTFQQINVSGGNKTGVDFKMADLSTTGKTLTATVSGAPANEEMDVFCHAMNDYMFSAPSVMMVTANSSGVASGTMKLQPNTVYDCGLGPHMPFESMTNGGPPPMPDFNFMPPPSQKITVVTSDVAVAFALTATNEQILGKVVDKNGAGIGNVYIDAFPVGGKTLDSNGALQGMMGSFGQSKSDGTFVIKVTTGSYEVGACSPGMPCSPPTVVDVKSNVSTADSNTTADVYQQGTLLTGIGLTLKMAKSSVTIAGTVKDEDGNPIKYAFVDAEQIEAGGTCSSFTHKGGFAGSPTDASGTYTLYIPPAMTGTTVWRVSANAPAYGQVACKIITVEGASKTGQTLQATANNFGSITITSTKGGTTTGGAFVGCHSTSGGNNGKTSSTDGTLTIKVPVGTYSCDGHLPGAGPLTRTTGVIVTAGNTATTTLAVGNPGTVNIDMGATMADDVVCSVFDSNGKGDHLDYNGLAVDLKVPAGDYTVSCTSPRMGKVFSDTVTVVAGQTNAVDKTAVVPTLYTVTGEVEASGANLEGSTVVFTDQSNARKTFVQSSGAAGANANVSVGLPAGTYSVSSMKDGYIDEARPEVLVVAAAGSFTTRSLAQAAADNVSITVQESSANYGGNAKVIATNIDSSGTNVGKIVFKNVDTTVASGANASISLPNGTWSIDVKADNGKKDGTPATVVVASNVADSSPTMTLDTAITGFTQVGSTKNTLTPSDGGLFVDENIAGLEVNLDVVDANDSTSGSFEMKQAPEAAVNTATSQVVGATAYSLTPKNSSGRELSDASGEVTLPITTAELISAGLIASGASATEIEAAGDKVAMGHLSNLGEWEALPTTFIKDAKGADSHIIVARTTSFSTFAPIIAADDAPSTPTGLALTVNGARQIDLAWTASSGATSYDIYRDTSSSGSFARVGDEPTVGAVTSYSNTSLSPNTTYYYKITAINNSGESAVSSAVSATTQDEGGGGGGGVGSVSISGPVASTEPVTEAEQVTVDTATLAVADLTTVANTSYQNPTVASLSTEVSKTVTAISTLASQGELTPANVATAQSAIKNLLIAMIKVTLELIQTRLTELLAQ